MLRLFFHQTKPSAPAATGALWFRSNTECLALFYLIQYCDRWMFRSERCRCLEFQHSCMWYQNLSISFQKRRRFGCRIAPTPMISVSCGMPKP